MPTYLHPGVYIEEIPSGVKTIEGVGTSTAAFVGFTAQGPVGTPRLIFSFDDYLRVYGGIRDLGISAQGDPMGFSVKAFFQNGGTKAYIVRLAAGSVAHPLARAVGSVPNPDPPGTVGLIEVTAVNEGAWANGLVVTVALKFAGADLYKMVIGRKDDKGKLVPSETFSDVSLDAASPRFIEAAINGVSQLVTVAVRSDADVLGTLTGTSTSGDLAAADLDLSALADADRALSIRLDGQAAFNVTLSATNFADLAAVATEIQDLVRDGVSVTSPRRKLFTAEAVGDTLVLTSGTRGTASSVQVQDGGAAALLALGTANGGTEVSGQDRLDALLALEEADLAGGADGEPAHQADFDAVFSAFVKVRDISILCLPDHQWNSAGQPFLESAIAHAESTMSRMVIVDPPAGTELVTESSVNDLGLPTSTYTVLYYPWVKVANPFFDEEENPGVPATLLAPPSGYAAGMWSKIDGRRGVWKAPAGVETQLLGLAALQFVVENAEQDQLNPLGVNALRKLNGFGHVIWGARTLSTKANPEWRYVPVRRTAIFIEQSLYNGIQWAVFEGNDNKLWSSLRSNVDAFMNGLFRSGAFQGEKASDAYFVRCGLGDTMTQADIDRGQVIVIVGFAPLKPAEFVIVRIQQKVAQQ